MRRLVIFGASNFAKAAHYYYLNDSDYEVAAFTVDAEFVSSDTFQGLPLVAWESLPERYPPTDFDVFVALGIRDTNGLRASKVDSATAIGYQLASYVSTRATVPKNFRAEPNTWIMDGAHVMPYVSIGRNTIVWAESLLAFNSVVGNHCWFAAASIGESVTIGDYTFLGFRSAVASFRKVGQKNIIGAGALILKDTEDCQIYREQGSVASRVPSTRFTNFNG